MGADEKPPYLKVLSVKPEDKSSIPKTHVVKGQNQLPKIVPCLQHTLWQAPVPSTHTTHIHKISKCLKWTERKSEVWNIQFEDKYQTTKI